MTAHLSTPYLRDMGAKAADLVASSLTPAAAAYLNQPVDHLASLPWPFADDVTSFRYTVNVDPARVPRPTRAGEWGRHIVDLGGADYPVNMAERRHVLDTDPQRVKVRPGMELACWDLLIYYLRDLAQSYPDLLSTAPCCTWTRTAITFIGATTFSEPISISSSAIPARCPVVRCSSWPPKSPTICYWSSNATGGCTSTRVR